MQQKDSFKAHPICTLSFWLINEKDGRYYLLFFMLRKLITLGFQVLETPPVEIDGASCPIRGHLTCPSCKTEQRS